MKNVAIIIAGLGGGGAERVASLLSQELSKKYNIYLIVFDSDNIAYEYGGQLVDINVKSCNNFFLKIRNVFRRTFLVKKAKKEYNIHTAISILGSANLINILSRREDKVITSVRSNLSMNTKDFYWYIYRQIIKHLYKNSDITIACSAGVRADLINNYGINKKITDYIYNPIDVKKVERLSICQSPNNYLFDNNQCTIINMGRLTDAKGQWHLIRALSNVKREIKDVSLVILGQGELEDYLKDLVNKLGLKENVVFLGHQENPFKYLSKADLFVVSSLYEGFSNVIIEAMVCGIPIISTDHRSGARELLAPGTNIECKASDIEYCEFGVLLPVCDGIYYDYNAPLTEEEKLLAKSIVELYRDNQLRYEYAKKGKDRAADFDIGNIVREWEALIG